MHCNVCLYVYSYNYNIYIHIQYRQSPTGNPFLLVSKSRPQSMVESCWIPSPWDAEPPEVKAGRLLWNRISHGLCWGNGFSGMPHSSNMMCTKSVRHCFVLGLQQIVWGRDEGIPHEHWKIHQSVLMILPFGGLLNWACPHINHLNRILGNSHLHAMFVEFTLSGSLSGLEHSERQESQHSYQSRSSIGREEGKDGWLGNKSMRVYWDIVPISVRFVR